MGNRFNKKDPPKLELTKEDVETILQTTSFDEAAIYDWHDGFMKDCPNGLMNKEKFITTYNYLYPDGNANKFAKQIFKVFGHSGEIEFNDFLITISLMRPGNVEKKISNAFMVYDMDQNGFIDKHEMVKLVDAIFELMDLDDGLHDTHERVDEIMRKLDKNNDHQLSKEEFIKGCMSDDKIKIFLIPS